MAKDDTALTAEEDAYMASGGTLPPPGAEEEPEGQEGQEGTETPPEGQEPPQEAERTKTVPHQALHQERLKARQERDHRERLERELQEQRDRSARLDERTRIILEHMQADEKPDPSQVAPDPMNDPIGHLNYVGKQLEEVKKYQAQQERAAWEQQQQAQQYQATATKARAQFDQDAADDPDVRPAYEYLLSTRNAELSNAYGLPSQVIGQMIANEEMQLVQHAFQQGRRISDMVKHLAVARGYKPGQQSVEQKRSAAEQKINGLERAKGASKSLSPAGGPPAGTGKMTLETLVDLPDDEFEKWVTSTNKKDKGLRRMHGLSA